jgi:hypothetical protein
VSLKELAKFIVDDVSQMIVKPAEDKPAFYQQHFSLSTPVYWGKPFGMSSTPCFIATSAIPPQWFNPHIPKMQAYPLARIIYRLGDGAFFVRMLDTNASVVRVMGGKLALEQPVVRGMVSSYLTLALRAVAQKKILQSTEKESEMGSKSMVAVPGNEGKTWKPGVFGLGDIQFYAEKDLPKNTVRLIGVSMNQNGGEFITRLLPVNIEQIEADNADAYEPFMELRASIAQNLVDALWDVGIRPLQVKDLLNAKQQSEIPMVPQVQLDTMRAHLDDMRKIALGWAQTQIDMTGK